MKNIPIGFILFLTFSSLASDIVVEESGYEKKYGNQMSTEAPDARNLTEVSATAAKGAVYANRHMSEFPTVAYNWEPSETPFSFMEAIKPLPAEIVASLEQSNTDGYIVVKDGTIIHEYYAKGMHITTKHAAYSTGKSWASAVWHDALLPVMDSTIDELMPELKGSVYGPETVRSVVDMRVPVYWYEDFNDSESPVVQSFAALGLNYRDPLFETVAFLKTLNAHSEMKAGDWIYASANTNLMGLLGPKLMKLHAYEGTRKFYHQLGLEYVSGSAANLHGQYDVGGGQYFTLRDFVKLPYAMANDGKVDGRQVVSQAYINDVFTADEEKRKSWAMGPYGPKMPMFQFYSNQWYIVDEDIAFGVGSYGQFLAFNRKTNVVIAKFSTYHTGQDFEMGIADLTWLLKQIRTIDKG